jgi:hypothetical protein
MATPVTTYRAPTGIRVSSPLSWTQYQQGGGGTARDPGWPTAPSNQPPLSQATLQPRPLSAPPVMSGAPPAGQSIAPLPPTQPPIGLGAGVGATGTVPGTAFPTGGNQFVPAGTDPWRGFAGQYLPGAADYLSSNPQDIFYNVAQRMGFASGQPGADMGYTAAMEPYAELMPYLYAIYNASGQNFGPEGFANFVGQFGNQLLTPGGMGPNMRSIMQTIQGNPMVQDLYRTGNTAQNMNMYNDILNMTAGLSFNPLMRQMVQAQQARLGPQYGDMFARGALPTDPTTGAPLSYDQYFNQNTGFGWV